MSRAEYMLSIAESCLSDVSLEDTDLPGFRRYIRREPLGVVFVIAPWKLVFMHLLHSICHQAHARTQLSLPRDHQFCPSRYRSWECSTTQTLPTDAPGGGALRRRASQGRRTQGSCASLASVTRAHLIRCPTQTGRLCGLHWERRRRQGCGTCSRGSCWIQGCCARGSVK